MPIQINPWLAFISFIVLFLALDLGAFHRRPRAVRVSEALALSAGWFALAMLFAGGLYFWRSRDEAVQFTTGYVIELSLSLDNVLVMAILFAYLRVPLEFQHRLLFLGVLGVLVTRGAMIVVGAALITKYQWILYLFGAFLVWAGLMMLLSKKEIEPEKNVVLRLARRFLPISREFDGGKFFKWNGRFAFTPLALALLLIETTDLIFAVDSVPAVFSVTRNAFIVFTSNVFAILGLRSMYFVLAGALGCFRYLKFGLSAVLVFIGIKMLLEPHGPEAKWFQIELPTTVSLMVVAAILLIAISLSVTAAHREKAARK